MKAVLRKHGCDPKAFVRDVHSYDLEELLHKSGGNAPSPLETLKQRVLGCQYELEDAARVLNKNTKVEVDSGAVVNFATVSTSFDQPQSADDSNKDVLMGESSSKLCTRTTMTMRIIFL